MTALPDAQHGVLLDEGGALVLLPARGRWPSTFSVGTDETVLALRVPTTGARTGREQRAEAVLEPGGYTRFAPTTARWRRGSPCGRSRGGAGIARGGRRGCRARRRGARAVHTPGRRVCQDVVPAAAFVHHGPDGPLDR
ncbi:MAG: hypothetical protein U0325_19985 [Polyangiales bacterium]